MQVKDVLDSLLNVSKTKINQLDKTHLLNSILLPRKADSTNYSVDEIEARQRAFHDEIELLQRRSNCQFDEVLRDDETKDQLEDLTKTLHNMQLEVLKLHCEIAFAKEQFDVVRAIGDDPVIEARRRLLMEEDKLKKCLKQVKFESLKEFFHKYAAHLEEVINSTKKSIAKQVSGYLQFFDWTQYSHIIYLLCACGKILLDVERYKRLYQSNLDLHSLVFKQRIDKMEFNNLIEFPDSYSLETQLEIFIKPNQKLNLKEWTKDPILEPIFNATANTILIAETSIFDEDYSKFKTITVDCCKLLVDVHMSYIEAHLTDGINVDKLNGGESLISGPQVQDQALPFYAMSPQEYITQIGQHLLTLRKQSEQFDEMKSDTLIFALQFLEDAQDMHLDLKSVKTVSEMIMRCIARLCIRSLLGRTGNSIVLRLTTIGKRQLATDALYLDNVLEDLGLLDSDEPNVEKFKRLLVH